MFRVVYTTKDYTINRLHHLMLGCYGVKDLDFDRQQFEETKEYMRNVMFNYFMGTQSDVRVKQLKLISYNGEQQQELTMGCGQWQPCLLTLLFCLLLSLSRQHLVRVISTLLTFSPEQQRQLLEKASANRSSSVAVCSSWVCVACCSSALALLTALPSLPLELVQCNRVSRS